MLRAITGQHQIDPNRLWFSDLDHDLFVWLDEAGQPVAFQFSYDRQRDERCIEWHRHRGYSHSRIDSGEARDGHYKMTPIMTTNEPLDAAGIAARFLSISADMDTELACFIHGKLCHAADH